MREAHCQKPSRKHNNRPKAKTYGSDYPPITEGRDIIKNKEEAKENISELFENFYQARVGRPD